MSVSRLFNRHPVAAAAGWVALCFSLTSAVYLSWVYRLVALAGGEATDWLSMVGGYVFQAAGAGLTALALHRRPEADHRRSFCAAALLFALTAAPALLSGYLAGALAFGYIMNLLCGIIAGYYLYALAARIDADHRAIAFGGGYAVATAALGVLSLLGGGLLRSRWTLPVYMAAAALLAALTWRLPLLSPPDEAGPPPEAPPRETLLLACGAVALMSLVKNLGFGFPSADIEAGLRPELWRVFYAVGLVAAGFINDRNRRDGAICTLAALILPFVMLAVSNEPVPAAICWGLDYLFFGFFSVFRVVLLMDLAQGARHWALAPLGLALGRVGDAAGTALCLGADGNTLVTVAITSALFVAAVLVFFQLYRRLYEPAADRQRSEREVFETFSHQHDLSSREREVLRLVLAERSNGEIAETLFVSESTVKYHVHNLLKKTGCKSRLELLKRYHAALYPGMEG